MQKLLLLQLLAPAVLVTALVPSASPVYFVGFDDLVVHKTLGASSPDSASTSTSTSSSTTQPPPPPSTATLAASNTANLVSLPSIDTTPSNSSNNNNGIAQSTRKTITWQGLLTVIFAEPPNAEYMGHDRLSALLSSTVRELSQQPKDRRPTGDVPTEYGRDGFYFHPLRPDHPRLTPITYGFIVGFINDVLIPHIDILAAAGEELREFTWDIKQTDQGRAWHLAEGAVYPL